MYRSPCGAARSVTQRNTVSSEPVRRWDNLSCVERWQDLREEAEAWTDGRSPWLRAALLAYLAYAGFNHLIDGFYRSWFAGITLIFHEMGHIIFSLFGRTLEILGGSIMQVVVPVAAGAHLLIKQRDFFGVAVCGSWLSFSLWEMGLYIWDAAREQLPLVGFGGQPHHDWGTLLTQWHVLNHCDHIAFVVRTLAFLVWLASVGLGGWLCWRMWLSDRPSVV